MGDEPNFDAEGVFDEDYLYFYADLLTDERSDAAARGVTVEYVTGDMRVLPWRDRFDAAVNWFTSFGYFDDAGNRRVLRQLAAAVRPGGTVAFELNNRDVVVRELQPHRVTRRGDDLLIDISELASETGRLTTRRTVVRDGEVRDTSYFVRLFAFTELRDWLVEAGFATVDGYGEDGTPLTRFSRRMIVVARR